MLIVVQSCIKAYQQRRLNLLILIESLKPLFGSKCEPIGSSRSNHVIFKSVGLILASLSSSQISAISSVPYSDVFSMSHDRSSKVRSR